MTQNNSETTHHLPHGQLLQILVENDKDRGLQYHAKWFRALDEQQQYEVAELVDRILRTISPKYRANVEKVDEAADLGFQIMARPPLLRVTLSLLRLRSWKDGDHDDGAPRD